MPRPLLPVAEAESAAQAATLQAVEATELLLTTLLALAAATQQPLATAVAAASATTVPKDAPAAAAGTSSASSPRLPPVALLHARAVRAVQRALAAHTGWYRAAPMLARCADWGCLPAAATLHLLRGRPLLALGAGLEHLAAAADAADAGILSPAVALACFDLACLRCKGQAAASGQRLALADDDQAGDAVLVQALRLSLAALAAHGWSTLPTSAPPGAAAATSVPDEPLSTLLRGRLAERPFGRLLGRALFGDASDVALEPDARAGVLKTAEEDEEPAAADDESSVSCVAGAIAAGAASAAGVLRQRQVCLLHSLAVAPDVLIAAASALMMPRGEEPSAGAGDEESSIADDASPGAFAHTQPTWLDAVAAANGALPGVFSCAADVLVSVAGPSGADFTGASAPSAVAAGSAAPGGGAEEGDPADAAQPPPLPGTGRDVPSGLPATLLPAALAEVRAAGAVYGGIAAFTASSRHGKAAAAAAKARVAASATPQTVSELLAAAFDAGSGEERDRALRLLQERASASTSATASLLPSAASSKAKVAGSSTRGGGHSEASSGSGEAAAASVLLFSCGHAVPGQDMAAVWLPALCARLAPDVPMAQLLAADGDEAGALRSRSRHRPRTSGRRDAAEDAGGDAVGVEEDSRGDAPSSSRSTSSASLPVTCRLLVAEYTLAERPALACPACVLAVVEAALAQAVA